MNKTQAKKVRHQNRLRRVREHSNDNKRLEWLSSMRSIHKGYTVGTIDLIGAGVYETVA